MSDEQASDGLASDGLASDGLASDGLAGDGLAGQPRVSLPPALVEAWRRFAVYDLNATRMQSRFLNLRIGAWVLGGLTTALAVLYSQVKPDVQPTSWREPMFHLWLVVLLIPIASSVLAAGALKVSQGVHWILLRGAAEGIKREIYLYRCRVGTYRTPSGRAAGRESARNEKLAGRVAEIAGRLLDSEIESFGLRPYEGELPPAHALAAGDDGSSDLTPGSYLRWRLDDQLRYFQRKAVELDRRYRLLHWAIAVLGGLGTLFVAIGHEIWVPVAVAVAGALGGYLELRRVESRLAKYSRACLQLENVRTWWSGLDEPAYDSHFSSLVRQTEAVLQSENSTWVEEMQEAIRELQREEREEGKVDE